MQWRQNKPNNRHFKGVIFHGQHEPSAAPSAAENTASAAQPGRGCLQVTAVHPYNLKDMRFDEAAQALAHATGCAVRYTDQELSAMKIAPVVGTMSIKDAIAAALDGSPYTISSD